MRWIKPKPKNGDTKIKKKFAILPIKIKDETRWLEWVTVLYQYHTFKWFSKDYAESGWFPEEFIDNIDK